MHAWQELGAAGGARLCRVAEPRVEVGDGVVCCSGTPAFLLLRLLGRYGLAHESCSRCAIPCSRTYWV